MSPDTVYVRTVDTEIGHFIQIRRQVVDQMAQIQSRADWIKFQIDPNNTHIHLNQV